MNANDTPRFMQLLAETLAAYGKPLPEAAMAKAWVANLAPFPLQTVALAMQAYRDENGEFAPVPAGIAKLCKLMDGRPGAEEAWGIALLSQNEADTVVWTAECAEAFVACRPILVLGDKVGARVAFKEAYVRLVAAARAELRPAVWTASVGWDGVMRAAALGRAAAAGLLPAPPAHALLAGPDVEPTNDDAARAQLARIRQMLVDGAAEREARRERQFDERIAAEAAERTEREKQVEAYATEHGLRYQKPVAPILRARHARNATAELPAHQPIKNNRLEGL